MKPTATSQTLSLPKKTGGLSAGGNKPEAGIRRVTSETLLGALHEMIITHNGREYRLRQTQNGKLILTA